MERDQLRTFAAVARLGSLSAASEAVHLRQPAVSRQVQALERRLGSPVECQLVPCRARCRKAAAESAEGEESQQPCNSPYSRRSSSAASNRSLPAAHYTSLPPGQGAQAILTVPPVRKVSRPRAPNLLL